MSDIIITAMATTISSQQVLAQDDGMIEEVTVTGIRSSLERSMDIKRESFGVVDAISAEDIGKFPDTNLAESLQRITGVSIDRVNGEGSEITVRGFGGNNNMVTLNGRTMPGGVAFGGDSGAAGYRDGNSRAFNFANLASESVSGVEVYKTGKADIATGGIGATINIKTARPLDNPGLRSSMGTKLVYDSTNEAGDDYTPEVSGIFSWTDDAERFGVALSGSFQKRDSGAAAATVNDWNIGTWGEDELYSFTDDAVIVNAPEEGQLYARPNDMRYSWSDRERERTNGQLTLQFRPMDNLTLTGDYTYAENDLYEFRSEQALWFANGNSVERVEFDDSAVATPVLISETGLSEKDLSFEQQLREQEDTLESFGFNANWEVNGALTLALDVHDSSMESLPAGPGRSGDMNITVAAPVGTSQTVDFSGDIPTGRFTFDDGAQRIDTQGNPIFDANGNPVLTGNANGVFDTGDFGSQLARIFYTGQKTDITQFKLDGSLAFDNGRFDFGVESRAMEFESQRSLRQFTLGDWGVNDSGIAGLAGLLEPFDFAGQFDDFNTSGDTRVGVRAKDVLELCQWAIRNYPRDNAACAYNPELSANNSVEEDTDAAYFQVALSGQLGGFPVNLLVGVRYETTETTSKSNVLVPDSLLWQDNNDFLQLYTDQRQRLVEETDYDHVLPSVDFDINFRDDLKGRFSYSKTIARANLSDLAAVPSGWATTGSSLNGAAPTANSTNPALVPLESDNLDLSLEWYYSDSSYVSLGFYEKRVDNFIGTANEDRTFFNMRDVTAGPRAQRAIEELEARGVPINDSSLFSMMVVMENPEIYPNGADDFVNDQAFFSAVGSLRDEDGNAIDLRAIDEGEDADPLMHFQTSFPTNQRQAKIYGFEFALQHFFGDTGFGLQANFTTVRGDVGFDDTADPGEQQFALSGLSDTANLVAIYENYGFQARLAYNWRDDYLSQFNRGASNNPTYVEDHSQLDLSVGYEVNDNLNVFLEGINLTEEDVRHYARSDGQLWFLEDLGARYQLGVRYTF